MSQPTTPRYRVPVLLASLAVAGALALNVHQNRQQASGICDETGQRLSDADILLKAESYAASLLAAKAVHDVSTPSVTLRIVSETTLRDENQVPAWVKNAGGFRAYVGIENEKGEVLEDQYGRPSLIAVSNCGKFRIAIYEYPRGWFW